MANRFLSNIRINDAYTFPASDGSNGQVIVTDGAGNLAFASPSTSSSASIIYRDNFTGDGSTTVFYLQNSLSDEDQTQIYIDGVYQEKGTYSLSNNAITFTTAPPNGDSVEVISISGINVGPTTIYQDNFTGDGATTDFTLDQSVSDEVKTMVYFNGVYQFKGTYSLNGTLMSFDTAPANGVAIEVISIASAAAADYNQKMLFYGKASEAISKGDAIMLGGQEGDHFLLAKATQAAIASNHEYFLGLASQDLATGEFGYVTEFGNIKEIDTSGYTAGDILWFDAGGSTAGALTTTEPAPPLAKIQVAAVIRSHQNEGVLFVRPTWYHELNELHDVNVTSVADKDLLVWDNANGYWENTKSLGDIIATSLDINGVSDLNGVIIGTNGDSINKAGNLYIQTTTASDLILRTNSVERVRIDSSGNLGIGTSTMGYSSGNRGLIQLYGTDSTILGLSNSASGNLGYLFADSNDVILYAEGSKNVTIGMASTGNVRFLTTNTERMRIDSSGNVGINCNADSKLQVVGSIQDQIRFGSNNSVYTDLWMGTGYTVFDSIGGNSGAFDFRDDGTSRMFIDSSGNLGLGVGTNPTSPLLTSPGRGNLTINGSSGSILTLGINGTWQSYYYVNGNGTYIASKADTPIHLEAGGTVKMRIDSGGNVGIGTTSPTKKLDVDGAIRTRNSFNVSDGTTQIGGLFPYKVITGAGTDNSLALFAETGLDLHFMTNGSVSSKMIINSSGNVGIGTTSPTKALHISKNSASSIITLQRANGNTTGSYGAIHWSNSLDHSVATIDARADGDNLGGEITFRTTSSASVNDPYGLTERMRIKSDGAVIFTYGGSGTEYGRILKDSYNYIIIGNGDVGLGFLGSGIDGTRRIIPRNTNSSVSNGLIDLGDAGSRFQDIFATNGTIQTSDANEKSNIQDSTLGLDFVNRLTPRSYVWNTGVRTHYGLISQEVEGVLNDLNISTQEFAGFIKSDTSENKDGSEYSYGLRYQEFIAPMIKAIQEQQEIIEDLKQRILTLENNNNG